jgi:hypothetical protein
MKLRSFTSILAISVVSVSALILTGCSGGSPASPVAQDVSFDDSGEPKTPGDYGFGVSGAVLPAINQNGDNLTDDDAVMAEVCQYVEAFETGTLRQGGEKPQTLKREEQVSDFRIWVLGNLSSSKSDYPEFDIYLTGAKERLADPSSNSTYYKALTKTCIPYNAMLTRTIAGWVEPTAVGPGNCWYSGDPKNLRAVLQKKEGSSWVTIETVTGFKKGVPSCSDKKYPYGYSTSHTFWESTEIRWVVTTLDGTRFDNGTKQDVSESITVTAGQSTVW